MVFYNTTVRFDWVSWAWRLFGLLVLATYPLWVVLCKMCIAISWWDCCKSMMHDAIALIVAGDVKELDET